MVVGNYCGRFCRKMAGVHPVEAEAAAMPSWMKRASSFPNHSLNSTITHGTIGQLSKLRNNRPVTLVMDCHRGK
jgi:hypothetical protein